MVECHLAKVDVEGSSPFSRSSPAGENGHPFDVSAGGGRFCFHVTVYKHPFRETQHWAFRACLPLFLLRSMRLASPAWLAPFVGENPCA